MGKKSSKGQAVIDLEDFKSRYISLLDRAEALLDSTAPSTEHLQEIGELSKDYEELATQAAVLNAARAQFEAELSARLSMRVAALNEVYGEHKSACFMYQPYDLVEDLWLGQDRIKLRQYALAEEDIPF